LLGRNTGGYKAGELRAMVTINWLAHRGLAPIGYLCDSMQVEIK